MENNMNKVILAQYYPMTHNIGYWMYSYDKRQDLYEEFIERVHASDYNHNSIAMMILHDGRDMSPYDIAELCRKTLHNITK